MPANGGRDTSRDGVAEQATEISLLSVSEAVMRMDLADQPVLMFRNSTTGELNVVYRRSDGNIGWIDPRAVTMRVYGAWPPPGRLTLSTRQCTCAGTISC